MVGIAYDSVNNVIVNVKEVINMEYTENLKLKKPEENEFYSVQDNNENMEKIDDAFGELNSNLVNLGTTVRLGGTNKEGQFTIENYTNYKLVDIVINIANTHFVNRIVPTSLINASVYQFPISEYINSTYNFGCYVGFVNNTTAYFYQPNVNGWNSISVDIYGIKTNS